MAKRNKNDSNINVNNIPPVEKIIPQINEDIVGIRLKKDEFQRTIPLSPMNGYLTPDNLVVPENEVHQDLNEAYDAFRVNPRLTKEDEIKKYGCEYHEFMDVNRGVDPREKITSSKKEKNVVEEVGISIGVSEITTEEKKEETNEKVEYVPSNNYFDDKLPEPVEPIYDDVPLVEPKFASQAPINIDALNNQVRKEAEEVKISVDVSSESANNVGPSVGPASGPVLPDFLLKNNYHNEPKTFEAPVYEEEETEEQEPKKYIYVDKYQDYKFPPLSLFEEAEPESTEIPEWVNDKIDIINQTLIDFQIDGSISNVVHGPTVTRYEIRLNNGVKVQKVTNITENLKMNLCAKSIRIEAPIPGKSTVGIEVPNEKVRKVKFIELLSDDFLKTDKRLKIALGLNIDCQPVYTDIAAMPHLLIAGGTGSGKSVCINTLLISILLHNTPDDVKMILVDPKHVELIPYADIPHLITPVLNDPKLAAEAIEWACEEMDRRYNYDLPSQKVKDITSYNRKVAGIPGKKKMPSILIVVDEFADLMMSCGPEFLDSVQRITQLGRAAGVHLVVATQRPSVDVITGTIKTNIASRIAFRVASYVDSNTIIDQQGAEDLLGRGDMLFKEIDTPTRLQGAYISDEEITNVCEYIVNNYEPDYTFTHEDLINNKKQQYNGASVQQGEDPELVYKVGCYVIDRGQGSVNGVMNSFGLGFNKAKRLMEILADLGVVSDNKGTTSRETLMTREDFDELYKSGRLA